MNSMENGGYFEKKTTCLHFVFLHFFSFQTNVTIFVLHFSKIYLLTLLLIWLKDLLLHKGIVKIDDENGWILRHVLSHVLFERWTRLLCKKCDPSLRNVQWPGSTLHNTSLANAWQQLLTRTPKMRIIQGHQYVIMLRNYCRPSRHGQTTDPV